MPQTQIEIQTSPINAFSFFKTCFWWSHDPLSVLSYLFYYINMHYIK